MSISKILAALHELRTSIHARNTLLHEFRTTIDTHLTQLESTISKSNFLILPIEPPLSSPLLTTNPSPLPSPPIPSISAAIASAHHCLLSTPLPPPTTPTPPILRDLSVHRIIPPHLPSNAIPLHSVLHPPTPPPPAPIDPSYSPLTTPPHFTGLKPPPPTTPPPPIPPPPTEPPPDLTPPPLLMLQPPPPSTHPPPIPPPPPDAPPDSPPSPTTPLPISISPHSPLTFSPPTTHIQISSPHTTQSTQSPTPLLPIKQSSPMEIEEKRDRDLCYNCDRRWSPTHYCCLKIFLLMGSEDGVEAEPPDPLPVVVGDTYNIIRPCTDETSKLWMRETPSFCIGVGNSDFLGCTGEPPPTMPIISSILVPLGRVSVDQILEIQNWATSEVEKSNLFIELRPNTSSPNGVIWAAQSSSYFSPTIYPGPNLSSDRGPTELKPVLQKNSKLSIAGQKVRLCGEPPPETPLLPLLQVITSGQIEVVGRMEYQRNISLLAQSWCWCCCSNSSLIWSQFQVG